MITLLLIGILLAVVFGVLLLPLGLIGMVVLDVAVAVMIIVLIVKIVIWIFSPKKRKNK